MRLLLLAIGLLLAAGGCRSGVTGAEAIAIVQRDVTANPAFRQNPAFDPASLAVGQPAALEASHDEYGPIPARWQVEVLLPEGKLFATYWIDRRSGSIYSLDISPLGHAVLDPKLPVIVREEPGTPEANAGYLDELLRSEQEQLLYWLRIAAGEAVPCGTPCVRDEDFRRTVAQVLNHCQKVDPGSLRSHPGYTAARHERQVAAFESACGLLVQGRAALGEPQESPEWSETVMRAQEQLAR